MQEFLKKIFSPRYTRTHSTRIDSFDRLAVSIFKALQGPEAIEWFPSCVCNSKCQYCGGYDKETISGFGKPVPFGNVVRYIELSGRNGTTTWNIGGRGGEPLLYRDLIGVLELIKRHKMRGILITNGLLLDEAFSARLAKAKWDILRISLDSHLPEIHDEIRGIKGNFKIIDNALTVFKTIKKADGSGYPYIICCPVISNKNFRYISEYIEYCVDKEVSEIQFMPLINVHDRAGTLGLSESQNTDLIASLEENAGEKRVKHNIGFMLSLYKNDHTRRDPGSSAPICATGKLYCIHLWKTLVISEDGYLSPCSLIKDKLVRIEGSLLKGWNSREMNALRAKVLEGELISSICKDCCGPLRNETDDFNRYMERKNVTI